MDRKIENNKIEYIKVGDYYIPNLVDTASVNASELGKYGRMNSIKNSAEEIILKDLIYI